MAGRIGAAERLVEGGCVTQDRECLSLPDVSFVWTVHLRLPSTLHSTPAAPTYSANTQVFFSRSACSLLAHRPGYFMLEASTFCSIQFLQQLFRIRRPLPDWTFEVCACARVCVLCKGRLCGCQEWCISHRIRLMCSRAVGLSSCEDLHAISSVELHE